MTPGVPLVECPCCKGQTEYGYAPPDREPSIINCDLCGNSGRVTGPVAYDYGIAARKTAIASELSDARRAKWEKRVLGVAGVAVVISALAWIVSKSN